MSEKNKVRFGLENLHVAPIKIVDDEVTFETPIHIPGVVGFNANPDGNDVEFWADNIKYYFREVNNGYTGDVETALFPDEILAKLLGWLIDEKGALVEIADATPAPFAIMGQFKGDKQAGRFVYYNCQAGRPSNAHSTQTETATPETETMPLEILPIAIEDKLLVKSVVEQDSEAYDSFFDEVYIPEFLPGGDEVNPLDATLSELEIGSLDLEPEFDPEVTEYTATTSNSTNKITVATTDDDAEVVITVNDEAHENGASATWVQDDDNEVVITVTNGGETMVYTITVTHEEG